MKLAFGTSPSQTFQALPQKLRALTIRLSRMVLHSTRVEQEARLDFSQLLSRLQKLKTMLVSKRISVVDIDVVAEELIARLSIGKSYKWDDFEDRGVVEFVSGVTIEVSVPNSYERILIAFRYADSGSRSYRNRNAILGDIKEKIGIYRTQQEFRIVRENISHGQIDYVFEVAVWEDLGSLNAFALLVRGWVSKFDQIS